jgi:hypothetical protein
MSQLAGVVAAGRGDDNGGGRQRLSRPAFDGEALRSRNILMRPPLQTSALKISYLRQSNDAHAVQT